jgi:hypothetical protein
MLGIGNPARTQPVPEVSERAEFLNRSTMVSI